MDEGNEPPQDAGNDGGVRGVSENAHGNGATVVNHLYTVGPTFPAQIFQFPDHSTGVRWFAAVKRIKDHIAAANETIGGATPALYRIWLQEVREFIATYGVGKVPMDIRYAVNNVERGIGERVTRWDEEEN